MKKEENCPSCGWPVVSIFDHLDIDCEHDMTLEEIERLEKESASEG